MSLGNVYGWWTWDRERRGVLDELIGLSEKQGDLTRSKQN
jgi:hypothetical protein